MIDEWAKVQGTAMRVKSGPFKGWEGVAQTWTSKTIELAFADITDKTTGKPERLWFQKDNLEAAS